MDEKERLDVLLVELGLAESREKAKAYIMAGVVYVEGQKEDKPGLKVKRSAQLEVRERMKYVSRGGLKLEKAMTSFGVPLEGKTCMDVGASTGGFTDCMLQNGAIKVYAVDVGYGQLAWKLRQDERVVCMEKTNIRYVTPEAIGETIDFSSIDVSFISLTKVLEPLSHLLSEGADVVALIKPQFEAGRDQVEKHGVVRKPKVHEQVIYDVWNYAKSIGFGIQGLDFSPIKGPEGNIEYLIHLKKDGEDLLANQEESISQVVTSSHQSL
ncbi:TlyA family rRNA (cytidine-2'-O)-methyltransferase [Sporanaerobium hydrogeniformans]|uniref:TlyA family rRNA (Cytidine-2'-O)-methyltransferase n=1 Tax=Sporanaerobium hydrogeniformans TaxID=3072179 RepID=A0AC61DGI9_9FIRM|nr:TlyA family RNA methyltransferase [Sporanaerobium hydrogeniformans]PHV72369.1 TlyA family rRNA (cytidine-2'-O)-methyltransferase [Sporanaerobium hydrogeniformans]